MSDSLWPHGLQHNRPFCPLLSTEVCPSSCLLHWCSQSSYPLTPSSPSALNFSQPQGLFQQVSCSHQWPKYWSFIFSISHSKYLGLISLKIDCFYLLAVQGTLRRFLQHHSSKASILQCPAFFTVQVSHLSMTTGKTIALTLWTFVGKVMSLLFNTLSRFVI